ncbi:MAG: hypothetical protein LUE64_05080, partial [Candidatus Gastranaerophilales bacterium]|nr:hypothetical protein [Candidatus Gastranaerophilales bacterium]
MPDKKLPENNKETSFLDEKSIRRFLEKSSDENYKKFAASLFKNPPKMLGVRLPVLRKLAKNIPCSYLSYIPEFMEETMLQGMVIGNLRG